MKTSSPWFLALQIFDLIHETDTHSYILKSQYEGNLKNLESGTFYQPSHIRDVKYSFRVVRKHLGSSFGDYTFIDAGCGKGIAVLIWRKLFPKGRIYGIDYYAPLIDVARDNHMKVFGDVGAFHVEDASTVDFSQFGSKFIIYVGNPFNDVILNQMLNHLAKYPCIIIYYNPIHSQVLREHGYKVIHQKTRRLPRREIMIFSNR